MNLDFARLMPQALQLLKRYLKLKRLCRWPVLFGIWVPSVASGHYRKSLQAGHSCIETAHKLNFVTSVAGHVEDAGIFKALD